MTEFSDELWDHAFKIKQSNNQKIQKLFKKPIKRYHDSGEEQMPEAGMNCQMPLAGAPQNVGKNDDISEIVRLMVSILLYDSRSFNVRGINPSTTYSLDRTDQWWEI